MKKILHSCIYRESPKKDPVTCYRAFLLLFSFCFLSFSYSQKKTLGLVKTRPGYTKDGYVLFSPMAGTLTYLMDKCGSEVHRWNSKYLPGMSTYLLEDGSLLRAGIIIDTLFNSAGRGGIIEKIDWSGKVVWSYRLLNDSMAQHHDIYPMDNGNILLIAWQAIPATTALEEGRLPGSIKGDAIWSECILEIKPVGTEDAEIVWRWNLWDHLVQDMNILKPTYSNVSHHPEKMNINYFTGFLRDWIHMNSIDYNKEKDQILVSCRDINEIWVIDHSTTTQEAAGSLGGNSNSGGDILYRWGNPAAYGNGLKSDQKLFGQHDAKWIPKGFKNEDEIILFNNGNGRSPSYSEILIIKPPMVDAITYNPMLPYGPSEPTLNFRDSIITNFYSPVLSGVQPLPNGNTLICSGNQGRFFEINYDHKIVWEYINPQEGFNQILKDGEVPQFNNVFNCTYYSDTFPGLSNKNLTPVAPIEKDPISYPCHLFASVEDTIAPEMVLRSPAKGAVKVVTDTKLRTAFNEEVVKGSGKIFIYENNALMITLDVKSSQVELISGTLVELNIQAPLKENTRISIAFEAGCFKDLNENASKISDSSEWYFTTVAKAGIDQFSQRSVRVFPNPSNGQVWVNTGGKLTELIVYNVLGSMVKSQVANAGIQYSELDLGNLADGTYFLKVDNSFTRIQLNKNKNDQGND
ncbi:MAG: aryl-sulfate sulfotransferase [Flavobacteriales bacterium]|nr:aryl-sulfate sulfotransferase [Flavobacteriales bacterium]